MHVDGVGGAEVNIRTWDRRSNSRVNADTNVPRKANKTEATESSATTYEIVREASRCMLVGGRVWWVVCAMQ
jgi:hypothetical protein